MQLGLADPEQLGATNGTGTLCSWSLVLEGHLTGVLDLPFRAAFHAIGFHVRLLRIGLGTCYPNEPHLATARPDPSIRPDAESGLLGMHGCPFAVSPPGQAEDSVCPSSHTPLVPSRCPKAPYRGKSKGRTTLPLAFTHAMKCRLRCAGLSLAPVRGFRGYLGAAIRFTTSRRSILGPVLPACQPASHRAGINPEQRSKERSTRPRGKRTMPDYPDPIRTAQQDLQAAPREAQYLHKLPPSKLLRLIGASAEKRFERDSVLLNEGSLIEDV